MYVKLVHTPCFVCGEVPELHTLFHSATKRVPKTPIERLAIFQHDSPSSRVTPHHYDGGAKASLERLTYVTIPSFTYL